MKAKLNACQCRLCGTSLNDKPIISMQPFPKAAQYYPTPEEFSSDKGIILNVFQCINCELVQLKIEPVSYYKEVITAASLSLKAKNARLLEIKNFVSEFELIGRRAIEIGCGKGDMLDVIEEAGLIPLGLEFGAASIKEAQRKLKNVQCGYINDFNIDNKLPVFFSFNFLEHQPDVKKFINAINQITTKDAVGYITVPNLTYLLNSKCLYEFVADHLVYFTEKTLTRAFEFNGFDVIRCEIINNGNDILAVVKKRQQIDLSPNIVEVETLAENLNLLVASYVKQGKKIAIWGAGHRSLALMAISHLNQIEFIVDSADFKQGKYSPVMFNKIVSPHILEHSDVDAVIVMVPGIYPQEVLATLKTFQRKMDAYKLEENKLIKINI
ncbi:MAG: methyltransferase domain-containing protein [Pseudomonadota bacterium]